MGNQTNTSLYFLLRRAQINEKIAPDILPFQIDVISKVSEWINHVELKKTQQSENLAGKPNLEPDQIILKSYLHELSRVKYLMSSYYQIRLRKIQQYILHYCEMIDHGYAGGLMSGSEKEFAEEYFKAWKNHMVTNVTRYLPPQFQSLIHRPDIDRHVVFCALFDLNDIIDNEEGSELRGIEKGSKWSIRYIVIRPYLIEGKVELI